MRKSIAIDMDGVMADVEEQFLIWYERAYGIRHTKEHLKGKTHENAFDEPGIVRKFVLSPKFFLDIPVMQGAVEAIKTLMNDFDVYVVSAAMEFPLSLNEKLEWLQVNFPFITWHNIIFCGDKSIIDTDYIIDDHARNLDNFKGKTILFDAFHNSDVQGHTRVNNWDDVLKLFEAER